MTNPRVSVITPVYNTAAYVRQAVASILAQTFQDFEYILVNDASTDESGQILEEFAAQDSRIRLLVNPTNLNASGAMNRGLAAARGEFVAVLDADDLAHPERLARQVAYLDAHPEVGVVGAGVTKIDAEGKASQVWEYPTDPLIARWHLLYGAPVIHSAACIRRALMEQVKGYSLTHRYANDFTLYIDLAALTQITNLPDQLVSYRVHDRQISATYRKAQSGEVWLAMLRQFAERLQLRFPLDDVSLFFQAARGNNVEDGARLRQAADMLSLVVHKFAEVERADADQTARLYAYVARTLLRCAWHLHKPDRPAAQYALAVACQLDPRLWQRPETRKVLRTLRAAKAAQTSPQTA
jgi:glycosyltransferase involved in cell wall biosynthesis